MMHWVLIIVLAGWGAGIGSQGNAVGSVDFSDKEKCETARKQIVGPMVALTICVEK